MNISGKKLKNYFLIFRYLVRAAKNLIFLITANRTESIDKNGAVVIIYRKTVSKYWFIGDPGLKDRVAYNTLKRHGFKPRVIFDPTLAEIQSMPERLVWFNPHHFVFGTSRQADGEHSQNLSNLIENIEDGGRKVFPSSKDILFWENKLYMHQRMIEKNLRHPKSKLCKLIELSDYDALATELGVPFLIKSPDGYSSNGLFLVKNIDDFKKVVPADNVIAQEFLNITMDLRLIMVDGVTESFYWRKNPPVKEWKPTATSGGATVQFHNLPISAESLGEEIYKLFGVHTFGADICWRNDDLTSEPYVLEFSPIYQPNPIPSGKIVSLRYSDYKEKTIFDYDNGFEELVAELFSKQLLRYRASLRVM
jgi:hypothetical protein